MVQISQEKSTSAWPHSLTFQLGPQSIAIQLLQATLWKVLLQSPLTHSPPWPQLGGLNSRATGQPPRPLCSPPSWVTFLGCSSELPVHPLPQCLLLRPLQPCPLSHTADTKKGELPASVRPALLSAQLPPSHPGSPHNNDPDPPQGLRAVLEVGMGRRVVGRSTAGREESLSLRPQRPSGVVHEQCLRTEERSRAGGSCWGIGSNRRGLAGRGRVAVSGVGGLGEW